MTVFAGSTVIESQPFVHCLAFNKKQLFCDFCLKDLSKCYRCSRCKFMFFCSKECQKEDWSIHKYECSKFSNLEESSHLKLELQDDLNRIFLRTIILIKLNDKRYFIDDFGLKTFDNLMDHYDDLVNDINRLPRMQSCFLFIKNIMGEDFLLNNKLSVREMISIFGKIIINAITISNFDLSEAIGSGIYLSVSSIDHSCEPNSVLTFNGSKIYVKAIRDLKPEEKPFISYMDILNSKKFRQQYLSKYYYFSCKCDRCLFKNDFDDKLITLKCIKCKKNMVKIDLCDNDNELISCCCLNCNKEEESTRQFYLDLKDLFNDVNSTKKIISLFDKVKNMIDKLENLIGIDTNGKQFCNIYLVKLYEYLFDFYNETEKYDLAFQVAIDHLLPSYKYVLPPNHPTTGILLLKIVKLLRIIDPPFKSAEFLIECTKILKICFEKENKIFHILKNYNEINH